MGIGINVIQMKQVGSFKYAGVPIQSSESVNNRNEIPETCQKDNQYGQNSNKKKGRIKKILEEQLYYMVDKYYSNAGGKKLRAVVNVQVLKIVLTTVPTR